MTKTLKILISLMLLAAMLLSVAAPALADGEKIIRTAIADDPEEMDPTRNSYSRSSRVLQNLFVGLYKLGPDGLTLQPACAESVDISDMVTTLMGANVDRRGEAHEDGRVYAVPVRGYWEGL